MRLYSYLYYKIYCGLRNLGKWDLPFKSMVAISTLEGFNIVELFFVTGIFPLKTRFSYDYKILSLLICVSLIILNSYLFLRKKNYLQIEKNFKKEPKNQKIIGDIFVTIYVIITIGFMFYLPRFI